MHKYFTYFKVLALKKEGGGGENLHSDFWELWNKSVGAGRTWVSILSPPFPRPEALNFLFNLFSSGIYLTGK